MNTKPGGLNYVPSDSAPRAAPSPRTALLIAVARWRDAEEDWAAITNALVDADLGPFAATHGIAEAMARRKKRWMADAHAKLAEAYQVWEESLDG